AARAAISLISTETGWKPTASETAGRPGFRTRAPRGRAGPGQPGAFEDLLPGLPLRLRHRRPGLEKYASAVSTKWATASSRGANARQGTPPSRCANPLPARQVRLHRLHGQEDGDEGDEDHADHVQRDGPGLPAGPAQQRRGD